MSWQVAKSVQGRYVAVPSSAHPDEPGMYPDKGSAEKAAAALNREAKVTATDLMSMGFGFTDEDLTHD